VTVTARAESGPARPRFAEYRRLLVFLRPHWWRMAGNIACNIIAAALDAFVFTLLMPFQNEIFGKAQAITAPGWVGRLQSQLVTPFVDPTNRLSMLKVIMMAVVVIVVVKNLFSWLAGQLGASLQEYVTRDLRDSVFRHMQRLPLGYFQQTKAGQIIAKILSDTDQTKSLVTELVTRTIQNGATIVVTIFVLVSLSLQLTILALVIAPLLTLTLQPILRKLRRGHRRLRNEYGEITSVLQEVVNGIRLVKAFGGERYEDGRFTDASQGYSSGMVRITRVSLLSQPLTEIIGTSIAVLILWIGAQAVMQPSPAFDAATLITFMILVMRLLSPLKQLFQTFASAQLSMAAAERLFDVLDRPTETSLDVGTKTVKSFERSVEFEDVSFAYEIEPVLRDIHFEAPKGSVIALVGASGAGKSTLVDLIPRFYNAT
jgi:ATP-binding cassette, subfamily B, bacterial MsbA